jgi:hypothetical protein
MRLSSLRDASHSLFPSRSEKLISYSDRFICSDKNIGLPERNALLSRTILLEKRRVPRLRQDQAPLQNAFLILRLKLGGSLRQENSDSLFKRIFLVKQNDKLGGVFSGDA